MTNTGLHLMQFPRELNLLFSTTVVRIHLTRTMQVILMHHLFKIFASWEVIQIGLHYLLMRGIMLIFPDVQINERADLPPNRGSAARHLVAKCPADRPRG